MTGRGADATIPLFPLGTVLVPGLVMPLHVFEPRYRALVAELLQRPEEEREFGVVAIREGHEVGADNVTALFGVGCSALLVAHEEHADGRFDIVTTGNRRFSVQSVDTGRPLLRGDVVWLGEPDGADVEARAALVRERFGTYRDRIVSVRGVQLEHVPAMPDDARVLSYLVASAMVLDLADRQALLEAPDTGARLAAELTLLRRETALAELLPSLPAGDLARVPATPN